MTEDERHLDLALAVPDPIHHTETSETLEYIQGWNDCRQAMLAEQPAPVQEPVAWLFQHEETGLTECVDTQQVEWGFEKNNPRWQKIAPLYTSPPTQRKPLTPTLEADTGYSRAQRAAFEEGWQEAEAAHGIKENA